MLFICLLEGYNFFFQSDGPILVLPLQLITCLNNFALTDCQAAVLID